MPGDGNLCLRLGRASKLVDCQLVTATAEPLQRPTDLWQFYPAICATGARDFTRARALSTPIHKKSTVMADAEQPDASAEPQARHVTYCGGKHLTMLS